MPVSRDRHNSADHFLYITRADVQIKGITASLGCKFYYSTVTPSNKFHTPLLTGVKTNWVRVLCWHRHCKQIPLNYYVNPFPQTNSFSHRCKIFEAIGIKRAVARKKLMLYLSECFSTVSNCMWKLMFHVFCVIFSIHFPIFSSLLILHFSTHALNVTF